MIRPCSGEHSASATAQAASTAPAAANDPVAPWTSRIAEIGTMGSAIRAARPLRTSRGTPGRAKSRRYTASLGGGAAEQVVRALLEGLDHEGDVLVERHAELLGAARHVLPV